MNSSLDAGIPLLTEIVINPPTAPALKGLPSDTSVAATTAASTAVLTAALTAASNVLPAVTRASQTATVAGSQIGYAAAAFPVSAAPPVMPRITTPAPLEPEFDVDFDIPEWVLPPSVRAAPEPIAPLFDSNYAFSAQEWEQLEINISERISRQVLNRIDLVLEQRVRDSLADVLQLAVQGLALDIKRGLQETLEDVIGSAVAQEIARLQTSKT